MRGKTPNAIMRLGKTGLDFLFMEVRVSRFGNLGGGIITPDFPQSEIAATNFYDSGEDPGELSAHFRASFAVQNDPQIFSKIPPNLSLHVL